MLTQTNTQVEFMAVIRFVFIFIFFFSKIFFYQQSLSIIKNISFFILFALFHFISTPKFSNYIFFKFFKVFFSFFFHSQFQ